ncbi:MAG: Tol-Pal system protein TolB, partial [Gammaproteobacteria bacterium]
MTLFRLIFTALLMVVMASAEAAPLSIEITRGEEGALPVAIVPFDEGGRAAPEDVAQIIADDLTRSGRFSPMSRKDLIAQPHQAAQINFADWRVLGMEGLVIGQVRATGADRYSVQFQLFNVFKGDRLVGYNINTTRQDLRRTAHQISDI